MALEPAPSREPTALEIAAAMAQGVLASGIAGPYGIAASALTGGALQLAQMLLAGPQTVDLNRLEALASTTGENVDAFSAKVDAKFPAQP